MTRPRPRFAEAPDLTNASRADQPAPTPIPADALMPRVFAGVATANVLLVAATLLLGLLAPAVSNSYHVALAVFTLILTCLVQVLGFTYLTVTFKLMAQAVHVAKLPIDHLHHAKSLKKRITRCLAAVITAVLVTTASGADSWRAGAGGWLHLTLGLATPLLLPWLLFTEFTLIARNASLVATVMRQYTAGKTKTQSAR